MGFICKRKSTNYSENRFTHISCMNQLVSYIHFIKIRIQSMSFPFMISFDQALSCLSFFFNKEKYVEKQTFGGKCFNFCSSKFNKRKYILLNDVTACQPGCLHRYCTIGQGKLQISHSIFYTCFLHLSLFYFIRVLLVLS